MAAPTKAQIQMLIVNKIFANAESSSKTLGLDVRNIYSSILDKLYGASVAESYINSSIDTGIKRNSVLGVRITGNRFKRYLDNLVYLAYTPFDDLPPRVVAENHLYPHLSYYSDRNAVTIGKSLKDITKLMLDKIYDNSAGPIDNNAFTYTFPFTLS